MKFKKAQELSEWAILVTLVSVVTVGALLALAVPMKEILRNISGAYNRGLQSSETANTTTP
jgi:hypothetical protein